MIVVTGATGKLGRQILERLLDAVPAEEIGASTRDPGKADDLVQRGVRVRYGDFSQPDSLAASLSGATQLLMVSSNAQAQGGDALAQHRAAIHAAMAAGVKRIVYTSHMGASATSAFSPMHTHAVTEAMLREAGIAWTALRNGFYASTVAMVVGDAASTGVIQAPADGKVSWTAHADLAAAAAQVLLEEGRFDGPTPPLTAAEALDLTDVAAIFRDLYRRPCERRVLSEDEQASRMANRGAPQRAIDITLGMYRAARAGEFTAVDPTLAALIGRQPATLRDILANIRHN